MSIQTYVKINISKIYGLLISNISKWTVRMDEYN